MKHTHKLAAAIITPALFLLLGLALLTTPQQAAGYDYWALTEDFSDGLTEWGVSGTVNITTTYGVAFPGNPGPPAVHVHIPDTDNHIYRDVWLDAPGNPQLFFSHTSVGGPDYGIMGVEIYNNTTGEQTYSHLFDANDCGPDPQDLFWDRCSALLPYVTTSGYYRIFFYFYAGDDLLDKIAIQNSPATPTPIGETSTPRPPTNTPTPWNTATPGPTVTGTPPTNTPAPTATPAGAPRNYRWIDLDISATVKRTSSDNLDLVCLSAYGYDYHCTADMLYHQWGNEDYEIYIQSDIGPVYGLLFTGAYYLPVDGTHVYNDVSFYCEGGSFVNSNCQMFYPGDPAVDVFIYPYYQLDQSFVDGVEADIKDPIYGSFNTAAEFFVFGTSKDYSDVGTAYTGWEHAYLLVADDDCKQPVNIAWNFDDGDPAEWYSSPGWGVSNQHSYSPPNSLYGVSDGSTSTILSNSELMDLVQARYPGYSGQIYNPVLRARYYLPWAGAAAAGARLHYTDGGVVDMARVGPVEWDLMELGGEYEEDRALDRIELYSGGLSYWDNIELSFEIDCIDAACDGALTYDFTAPSLGPWYAETYIHNSEVGHNNPGSLEHDGVPLSGTIMTLDELKAAIHSVVPTYDNGDIPADQFFVDAFLRGDPLLSYGYLQVDFTDGTHWESPNYYGGQLSWSLIQFPGAAGKYIENIALTNYGIQEYWDDITIVFSGLTCDVNAPTPTPTPTGTPATATPSPTPTGTPATATPTPTATPPPIIPPPPPIGLGEVCWDCPIPSMSEGFFGPWIVYLACVLNNLFWCGLRIWLSDIASATEGTVRTFGQFGNWAAVAAMRNAAFATASLDYYRYMVQVYYQQIAERANEIGPYLSTSLAWFPAAATATANYAGDLASYWVALSLAYWSELAAGLGNLQIVVSTGNIWLELLAALINLLVALVYLLIQVVSAMVHWIELLFGLLLQFWGLLDTPAYNLQDLIFGTGYGPEPGSPDFLAQLQQAGINDGKIYLFLVWGIMLGDSVGAGLYLNYAIWPIIAYVGYHLIIWTFKQLTELMPV